MKPRTLDKYLDLGGRTALITGGARGIGFESARLIGEAGAGVFIADINFAACEKSAARLREDGLDVEALPVDVAAEASIQAMADRAGRKTGKIDILVNNAGILSPARIPDLTVEEWDRMLDVDLRSAHLCSQKVLPYMIKAGSGRMVFLSSQAGQMGGFLAGVHYSAAKGGVLALMKSYAKYGAAFNITCNCVSPGFLLTDMTRDRDNDASIIPLKRLGSALDAAQSVFFLCTGLAGYITGASIDVNGGYYMRA
ncbi:MAG: SDR family oxidoreductase [Planctomycetota bacterium]|jgi:NAD(P)-dependent dehydrogenase (short-subunit alcohol dehydrogenase family)|nr:SDR family oxidoreductase [Planctomycetota bacterium]